MKTESKLKHPAALPLKPVAEELVFLRKSFKELLTAYTAQVEGGIARLQSVITGEIEAVRKVPASRVADLRDMLMLLRNFDIKPAKGRRRDLKKIENLVHELEEIVDRWEG